MPQAKHGQRKQAWRDPISEKNHASQLPDRNRDEVNHNSSEHHDDTPDEEVKLLLHSLQVSIKSKLIYVRTTIWSLASPSFQDAAHSHKQKNEHRCRNRGRSGRQKHRGANGMGTQKKLLLVLVPFLLDYTSDILPPQVMEQLGHLVIPMNPQSHRLGQECRTELGDSQWDVVVLQHPTKVNRVNIEHYHLYMFLVDPTIHFPCIVVSYMDVGFWRFV